MRKLQHENLISIDDIFFEKIVQNAMEFYQVNLVMDYYEKGDFAIYLKKRLPSKNYLSQHQALTFMKETASAINYLHERNLMHRDLKPQNIFVTSDEKLKIGGELNCCDG